MRKFFSKPWLLALITAFIVTLSPFDFPPDPRAHALPITFHEIQLPKLTRSLVILTERTPEASKAYARTQLSRYNWDEPNEWNCLEDVWTGESNWHPNSYNHTPVFQNGQRLHAGGIPQILGLDPTLPVETQIQRGLDYIKERYGSPCSANRFWHRHFWY